MPKTVFHLFHADPASVQTGPTLADPDKTDFNAQIDALVTAGVQVTAGIGIAEDAFRARNLGLESAAVAFPRYAAEGATVISF